MAHGIRRDIAGQGGRRRVLLAHRGRPAHALSHHRERRPRGPRDISVPRVPRVRDRRRAMGVYLRSRVRGRQQDLHAQRWRPSRNRRPEDRRVRQPERNLCVIHAHRDVHPDHQGDPPCRAVKHPCQRSGPSLLCWRQRHHRGVCHQRREVDHLGRHSDGRDLVHRGFRRPVHPGRFSQWFQHRAVRQRRRRGHHHGFRGRRRHSDLASRPRQEPGRVNNGRRREARVLPSKRRRVEGLESRWEASTHRGVVRKI
eukprot:jgi/Mesvir1/26706/Mv25904-RA.1